MVIYLVRHGEVEHNRLGYYSNEDEDLNECGIRQAEALRGLTQGLGYEACYCSPLLRAVHTAEIWCGSSCFKVDHRLKERDPITLNGKPVVSTDRDEYWNYYTKVDYGAEPIQAFFGRVWGFLDWLKGSTYEKVLIVAHSGVSKAFAGYFNGIPEDGKFLYLGLGNCEVAKYRV